MMETLEPNKTVEEQFIETLQSEFKWWLEESELEESDFRDFLANHNYTYIQCHSVDLDVMGKCMQIYLVDDEDTNYYVAFDEHPDYDVESPVFGTETDWPIEESGVDTPYSCSFWWWVRHNWNGEGPDMDDYVELMKEDNCSLQEIAETLEIDIEDDDGGWWVVQNDWGGCRDKDKPALYCNAKSALFLANIEEGDYNRDLFYEDNYYYQAPEGHYFVIGSGGPYSSWGETIDPREFGGGLKGGSGCMIVDTKSKGLRAALEIYEDNHAE